MRREMRFVPALIASLAAAGPLFGCGQQGASYNGQSAVNHAQSIVDQQIKDVQDSKYLSPEQKEVRIAQIRAMNSKLGKNAPQGR